ALARAGDGLRVLVGRDLPARGVRAVRAQLAEPRHLPPVGAARVGADVLDAAAVARRGVRDRLLEAVAGLAERLSRDRDAVRVAVGRVVADLVARADVVVGEARQR